MILEGGNKFPKHSCRFVAACIALKYRILFKYFNIFETYWKILKTKFEL